MPCPFSPNRASAISVITHGTALILTSNVQSEASYEGAGFGSSVRNKSRGKLVP